MASNRTVSFRDVLQGFNRDLSKTASDLGTTTHPIDSIPDRSSEPSRGSGDAQDSKDMKEKGPTHTEGRGVVNETGTQESAQTQLGLRKSETGNDPSVEQGYKTTSLDPGSTHPARADNESIGTKYASLSNSQLSDLHDSLANSILADLVNSKQASVTVGHTKAASPRVADKDFAAGYELAQQLGLQKNAAEKYVADVSEGIIRDALTDADNFGSFYTAYLQKVATDETDSENSESGDAEYPEKEYSESAGPPAAQGEESGLSLGDVLSQTAGSDPAADMAAQGAPSDEQALTELVSALQELGISPEELMQASQESGGGMGGDPAAMGVDPAAMGGDPAAMGGMPMAPAMMGGMPPAEAAMPTEGVKLASAAKAFKRSGKWQFKTAAAGSNSRIVRDHLKQIIREMVSR